jgi:hypothetical protein
MLNKKLVANANKALLINKDNCIKEA